MPHNWQHQAEWFALVTPNCTSTMVADFLDACDNIAKRPPLAQDGSPPKGGSAMPYPRYPTRDQDFIPGANGEMTPRGGMQGVNIDQDPDQDDPGATMSPETLMNFVQLCANRLAANDDNGESHNQFMNLLGEMVAQAHQNGMVNGDRAHKRAARDDNQGQQYGYSGRKTPGDNFSGFNGRGSMDRKRGAMDSAVRAINHRGFLQRFPEAKNISIRG